MLALWEPAAMLRTPGGGEAWLRSLKAGAWLPHSKEGFPYTQE
jgi:hypothetical protein